MCADIMHAQARLASTAPGVEPPLTGSCRPLTDPLALRADWLALQSRAACSFFISWDWIGPWLANLPPQARPYLLRVDCGTRTVGLGVVVRGVRRLGPVRWCESWHLHESGDADYDNLTIEHNGVLSEPGRSREVMRVMLDAWSRVAGGRAELRLPGLGGEGALDGLPPRWHVQRQHRPASTVMLAPVREAGLDFTKLLSAHSRRFVRRSIKEYEQQFGPLQAHEAGDLDEARSFLAELIRLHERTWARRGEPGAFRSPRIRAFHDQLIEAALPRAGVQLLRIQAGTRPLGYLYSFLRGGTAFVYQSGFEYGLLEKHDRPGLVVHTVAIQHMARQGLHCYDLLAGESQYKSSISTGREPMTWVSLAKPSLLLSAERSLRERFRALRAAWRRRTGAAPATPAAPAKDATEDAA